MTVLSLSALAAVIEAEWWDQCAEDVRPPAWPGGGGVKRWKAQFHNCALRALAAGQECRRSGIAGAAMEHALAVAIFVGFWEPTPDWAPIRPPTGFAALPGESYRDVFRACARAVIAFARAQRTTTHRPSEET